MRLALIVVLLIALLPSAAIAQNASPPTPTPAPRTAPSAAKPAVGDPTQLSDRERQLVRRAVGDVRKSYKNARTADGVGYIIGGALVGGIGMYLYLSQDDPNIRLIGVAIAFGAVPQLVAGVWNLFYHTAQEDIADKLLSNDKLLDGAGLVFVEQEARRGKRARLVGGSTSILQGAATLGSYFLLKEFFVTGPDNILLIFFAVGTAFQVIDGVITLVSKSGPEKAYARLIQDMGRDPLAPPAEGEENRISRTRIVPTVLADDGKLAPGFAVGLSF